MKRRFLMLLTALSLLFSINAFASTDVNTISDNEEVTQVQYLYNLTSSQTVLQTFNTGSSSQLLTIQLVNSNADIYVFVDNLSTGGFSGFPLSRGGSTTVTLKANSRIQISASTYSSSGRDTVNLDIR